MKKKILFAVLSLMAVLASPAMATDFSWNGEVTLGAITDFTVAHEGLINSWLNLDGKVNDNLSWHTELGFNPSFTKADYFSPGTWVPLQFYYYYGSAELGNILGLTASGIDPVLNFGYVDALTPYYNLSTYDYESVGDFDPGSRYNLALTTTFMKMVSLLVTVDPASMWTGKPLAIASLYGTFGVVSAALNYSTNENPSGGVVGTDVRFQQAMGDLTVGVDLNAKYDTATSGWAYGTALRVAYATLINVAAGLAGFSTGLGNLGVNINLVPVSNVGVDLNLSMNLGATGATPPINGGDFSVWGKMDKSTVRLGYLYSTMGAGNIYAVAEPIDGGLYLNYDLTF